MPLLQLNLLTAHLCFDMISSMFHQSSPHIHTHNLCRESKTFPSFIRDIHSCSHHQMREGKVLSTRSPAGIVGMHMYERLVEHYGNECQYTNQQ